MLSVMKARLRAMSVFPELGGDVVVDDLKTVSQSEVPIGPSQSEFSSVVMVSQSDPTSILDSETMDPVLLGTDRNGSRAKSANSGKDLCTVGVTNVESASELLQVTAGTSTISSLSPIWKAATSDPTGRTLRGLVDLLSEEASDVILQLGSSVLGKRGEEVVFRVMERVDYCMDEIMDYVIGPPADQCVQLLHASKSELMDLLLRSKGREAEWSSGSSTVMRQKAKKERQTTGWR